VQELGFVSFGRGRGLGSVPTAPAGLPSLSLSSPIRPYGRSLPLSPPTSFFSSSATVLIASEENRGGDAPGFQSRPRSNKRPTLLLAGRHRSVKRVVTIPKNETTAGPMLSHPPLLAAGNTAGAGAGTYT